MTTPQLRIGIIGAGRIGSLHGDIVAHEVPGATLAAVADVMPDPAVRLSNRLGVRAVSVDDMIESPDIDAVAICTSTDSHVEFIMRAAAAGKAIFCEKPISLNLDLVDKALGVVHEHGVPLMIGFNRRFDPSHRAVRDAVLRGEVGDVHIVRITSRDPAPPPISYIDVSGGIFLDMTIHDFDMARFVTGSEVVELYAQAAVRVDPAIGEAGDFDTVVVTMRHANGALTVIDNSRQALYGYDQRVEVFGALGMSASNNWTETSTVFMGRDGARSSALQNFFLERYRQSYQQEWREFVQALATGAAMPTTGADGRAPLVLGLAAAESVRTGRPVLL